MNEIVHTIKNLTIIDIDKLIDLSLEQAKNFCAYNNITFTWGYGDSYKLTLHYFFYNFFLIYKEKKTRNILCYSTTTDLEKCNNYCIVNINKKIIDIIKNKTFNFPTILSNMSVEEYIKLVSDDSPEYDEAINNNFDLIDNFGKIKQYFRTSKLLALNKKYNNLTEKLNLLLNI